jgi:transposase
VVAVDSNQFRVISHSVKKTDPNDARNLALYLAKGLLPEVRMKEKQQAEVASLTQTRDRLVKLRTALKNKVNNLLSARGIELDKESLSSEKGLTWVLEQRIEPLAHLELDLIVEQIRSLNRSIARLERAIEEASQKLPGYRHLTSIKGMGSLGAGILLSGIGDVKDFDQAGKLAAYFGIVPRVQDSNETEHRGRITKRGSKLGRTALVQCALIAKRYSPYLHRYYERLRARRGTGKAIIALARKSLSIIYGGLTLPGPRIYCAGLRKSAWRTACATLLNIFAKRRSLRPIAPAIREVCSHMSSSLCDNQVSAPALPSLPQAARIIAVQPDSDCLASTGPSPTSLRALPAWASTAVAYARLPRQSVRATPSGSRKLPPCCDE